MDLQEENTFNANGGLLYFDLNSGVESELEIFV